MRLTPPVFANSRLKRAALALVALLSASVALSGCVGASATPTPTKVAPQAAAKAGAKIVTDLSQMQTTPTVTVVPTPTIVKATATPIAMARLEIQSYRHYRDSVGSLWVVGEARNTGDAVATGVDFKVTLTGVDGKALATTWATVHLGEVAPGKMTPFKAMISQPPKEWQAVEFDVTASAPTPNDPSGPTFIDSLVVDRSSLVLADGKVSAIGQVSNSGKVGALAVRVLAVLRGSDGKVVDVADGYINRSELAAGANSPFSLQFYDGKATGPFEVFVQGRLAARE